MKSTSFSLPGDRISGGLYPKKYGQIFLKDRNIAAYEVKSLGLGPGSKILEIGPGSGILTGMLLESGFVVTAVEPDHRFVQSLSIEYGDHVKDGSLTIVKKNFLDFGEGSFHGVIGNVPYHLSSPILFSLDSIRFGKAILMFQEEFARRTVALPGDGVYSRLSVNVQLRYNVNLLRKVPRKCFSPVPDVDSRIIMLEPLATRDIESIRRADEILKMMFSRRRKKISGIIPVEEKEIGEKRVEEVPPEKLLSLILTYLAGNPGAC